MRTLSRLSHFLRRPWRVWHHTEPGVTVTVELIQKLPLAAILAALLWQVSSPAPVVSIFLFTLIGLLLGGYGYAVSMARGLSGKRGLRYDAVQVGDELEEEVEIRNTSWLPNLWVEVIDRSTIPGYTITGVRAVGGELDNSWRQSTICDRRGVFTLGPWELVSGDPFGFFRVQRQSADTREILVYPPAAQLPEHFLSRQASVGDRVPLRQPLPSETIHAISTRSYVPGDPLRRIHWRTSARRNEPFVKIFEPEAASSVWLLADVDAGVHLGNDAESSLETMVLLLASLSLKYLNEHLAVGLYAPGAAKEIVVLPGRGKAHQWEILRALALVQPIPQPFPETIHQAQRLITGRDLIVAVTPSLDAAWARALKGALQQHEGSAGAVLLDPFSFGGPSYAKADTFLPYLTRLGITAEMIQKGQLKPISGQYGELSRWEFTTFGTGKVHVRHAPRQAGASTTTAAWRKKDSTPPTD